MQYSFTGKYFAPSQLTTEISSAGLPSALVLGQGFSSDSLVCLQVDVSFSGPLNATQLSSLQQVVAAHSPTVTAAEKLDLANFPTQRLLAALCILSSTLSTATQKTAAQTLVDNAYNALKALLS